VNGDHALARQARLCAHWQRQARVVVLQLGFGNGSAFVQAWAQWRADATRCQRLLFVAVTAPCLSPEAAPDASADVRDLSRQLRQAWPPATANLHSLSLEGGRVQLLLAMGDANTLLPALRLAADVLWLEAGPWSARLLASLGRKAVPGALLDAAALTPEQRAHLHSAGFVFDASGQRAHLSPHASVRAPASVAIATTQALVIGAGVAGAAVTQALVQRGLTVTVLDQQAAPATAASGNTAALFHGAVHGHDGHYARLLRAGALQAQRALGAAMRAGQVRGAVNGCLRMADSTHTLSVMQHWLQAQSLPADYVQALDRRQASDRVGTTLQQAAWFYPGGGWVAPVDWVRAVLMEPGVRFVGGADVQQLARDGADWVALDVRQQELARAPVVVLANAASAQRLLVAHGHAPWPTSLSRGQVSQWHDAARPPLHLPLGGDGYVLSLPGGEWLCGATREQVDVAGNAAPRAADHALNLARAQRLGGIAPPPDAVVHGRVGWRLQAADSLPIAGPVPLAAFTPTQRLDQARLMPREAGLFVLTALGARGLTWAPLLGELIAAQIAGDPWPLEQELVDAVDPARFGVRQARTSTSSGHAANN
jgi:tRNA 5-methylaminomethyl-2-thiouridine biosynthesis bifunctional protein